MLSAALAGRPRILNTLHALRVAAPFTQTLDCELACLARYARNRRIALEIGSFQGVSAGVIARAMHPDGRLYCVDPWSPVNDRENAVFSIAKRHLRRAGVLDRISLLQGTSCEMAARLPGAMGFAFIDGDHSYQGLATDWAIVAPRMAAGGIVCLHDTSAPEAQDWPTHGSMRYFDEVVRSDTRFCLIDTVHSLNVLERLGS